MSNLKVNTIQNQAGNAALDLSTNGIIKVPATFQLWLDALYSASGSLVAKLDQGHFELGPGTATSPPLDFDQTGVLLTTPISGGMEYDGIVHYLTSNASHGRGVAAPQLFTTGALAAPANVATAQNLFPAANDTLTVVGNTTYQFEALLNIATTGITSNSLGLSILGSGTATLTSIAYQATATNGTAATPTASTTTYVTSGANTAVTAAVAAATNRTILVNGIMRVNAGGTIVPQFTFSAAPGAAPTLGANNYMLLKPLGNGSVAAVGAWA